MDINKLADKVVSAYMPGCPKNYMGFIMAKEMFISGYNRATTTWYPMSEAPKGKDIILTCGKDYWIGTKQDAITAIAWTHLPVYNQENQ